MQYKAEIVELDKLNNELKQQLEKCQKQLVDPANIQASKSTPKPIPTDPSDDSIDFEELVTLARMPAEKVSQQLEQKGFVVAGSKIYEPVSGHPNRFIIKRKRN